MKKVQKLLIILSVTLFFTGCLSSGIDIVVNKDGSGEIIQTFEVQKDYVGFVTQGTENPDPNMINKEELINRASQMGEGVRFVRVEPSRPDSPYAGYKAFYSFSDISKIRTTATPMTSPVEMEESDSDWIRFDFERGTIPTLTIISSSEKDEDYEDDDEQDYDSDEAEQTDEGMQEQMKQIYKTMHFWFKVRVNGRINDTNAAYSGNSEVVIMDMNFERIVENDDLFSHITSVNSSDLDSIRDQLEEIGVKIDDQEIIEISFK